MEIGLNVNELTLPANTETAGSGATVGKQEFLTLRIAQLENQDPLSPQDPTEFTTQLTQFSILEELIAIRTAVERLEPNAADSGESTESA